MLSYLKISVLFMVMYCTHDLIAQVNAVTLEVYYSDGEVASCANVIIFSGDHLLGDEPVHVNLLGRGRLEYNATEDEDIMMYLCPWAYRENWRWKEKNTYKEYAPLKYRRRHSQDGEVWHIVLSSSTSSVVVHSDDAYTTYDLRIEVQSFDPEYNSWRTAARGAIMAASQYTTVPQGFHARVPLVYSVIRDLNSASGERRIMVSWIHGIADKAKFRAIEYAQGREVTVSISIGDKEVSLLDELQKTR